jgi:drug/metabolite transporter (DMT)-like permease
MGYVYILLTVAFTVYGQLAIKSQVTRAGAMPDAAGAKLLFLLRLMPNPWVLSGFAAALIAAIAWMAALTKFDLSFAYPFQSLSFIIVMFASALILREPLTVWKLAGMALIVLGIIVSSRSA